MRALFTKSGKNHLLTGTESSSRSEALARAPGNWEMELNSLPNCSGDILDIAQSHHRDFGISREPGLATCWIERRYAQKSYGGTIRPPEF